MHTGRLWALVLLLYVIIDFTDPSTPGVFFFDTDHLFVDAAVTLAKTTPSAVTPAASPRSEDSGRSPRELSEPAPTSRALGRPPDVRARHHVRSDSFHDASASVSPEDH